MELLINYLIMLFFVGLQSYYYFKVPVMARLRMPVVITITTFSMIITPMLMVDGVVGTPYVQLFFIVYQMLVFFFSMWEYRIVKSG